MAEYTLNYKLRKVLAGERFSDEGYKFSGSDRDLIDALLHGTIDHHHDGAVPDPDYTTGLAAPTLALGTVGAIPAGTRVFYKYGLVDPNGLESAGSAEAYVDTPVALSAPNAPALELSTAAGTLLPGAYYYVLTTYYPTSSQESEAGAQVTTKILSGTTNQIIIHFPTPPVAAVGFNIYRQRPGESNPVYLASVPITVAGVPPANYTDNGSVTPNNNRPAPTKNTTQSTNSVAVTLPAAVDPLPDGWTWRLYRTYLATNYDQSLVHWVTEETAEGSGIIVTAYTDTGTAGFTGAPSTFSQIAASPDKVDLATEVTGVLPAANGGGSGVWAKASSTANVNVAAFSGTTIDGITLSNGDPILLKDQTTGSQNGLWLFAGAGNALTRPAYFATGSVQSGMLIQVQQGAMGATEEWVLVGGPVTVGTTAQTWRQLAVVPDTQLGTLLDSSPAGVALGSSNDAVLIKLVPYKSMSVTKFVWFMGAAATNNYDVGIYDDGATTMTRLWSKGSTAAPTVNTAVVETVTGVTLVAGVPVWAAFAANGTTITPRGVALSFNEDVYDDAGVATILRFATSFALPSTLTRASGGANLRKYKFMLRSA